MFLFNHQASNENEEIKTKHLTPPPYTPPPPYLSPEIHKSSPTNDDAESGSFQLPDRIEKRVLLNFTVFRNDACT